MSESDDADDMNTYEENNISKLPIISQNGNENRNVLVLNKKFDITMFYDYNSFPENMQKMDWLKFTTPLLGKDLITNQKIKD